MISVGQALSVRSVCDARAVTDRQPTPLIPIRAVPFAAGLVLVGSAWNVFVDAPGRALVVLLVAALAVLLAPRTPMAALALIVLSAVIQLLLGVQVNPGLGLTGAAFYAIGRRGSPRQHRLAVGAIIVFGILQTVGTIAQGALLAELVLRAAPLPMGIGVITAALAGIAVLVVPLLAGIARQAQALAADDEAARQRAEQQLQRTREEAAVEAERARLARDVHDTVGHALTVVITQARLLSAVSAQDPDAVAAAAATVESVASAALDEVRSVLAGTVRLADVTVDELVELAGSTDGITVEVHGASGPLVGQVGEAAYRAVQELVTNALRHGENGRPIDVSLTADESVFEVLVKNTVTDASSSRDFASGSGLQGLRDRLRDVDGELVTAREDRQWSARARIPL